MQRTAVIVLVACSAPAKPTSAPPPSPTTTSTPSLDVPFATAPVIDGTIDAREWATAATITLDGGLVLRFVHDRARVYIALARAEPIGFTCVFVADEPSTIRVLHASAKLGSATYAANAAGTFDPRAKEYAWRDRDAMQREEGWLATTMKPDAPPAQEFAIDFATLGLPGRARPIAISFFHAPPDATDLSAAGTTVWPPALADGVANVQLVAGFNPDGVRFEPRRWVTLVPR